MSGIKVTCNSCEKPIVITPQTKLCPLCGKTFWIEVKRA